MMKQKVINIKQPNFKIQEIDGPPLDYSFKSIRNLAELLSISINESKPILGEQIIKVQETVGQQHSEKQIGDLGETKLNIVRTIDVDETKGDSKKQMVHKKTEKLITKSIKKTELKTTSLFLRYNKITTLDGFQEIISEVIPNKKWQQLIWIDLSHNRLTNISKELCCLPQLKNLYLHVNFINNFKEFQNLQSVHLLRTFTIHGNPIENYPEFRSLLTCILPQLQKIDSALLTKRQKQRGQVLKKQNVKYPVIQNPQKPPEQSQEQEQN